MLAGGFVFVVVVVGVWAIRGLLLLSRALRLVVMGFALLIGM